MHTLVLDIGNTAVKAGCFAGDVLHEMAGALTLDAVQALVARWGPQHLLIASVADEAARWALALQGQVPGRIVLFQPGATPVPMRNAYATPTTLGADRLAGAVGAAALRPGLDTLVLDAGTALKCDLVTADGTYHGGSIGPGLNMRLRALHEFTGRLPLLALPTPDATIPLVGTSTVGALLSGVVNGAAAEANGLVAAYRQLYPALGVVLTGGDAPLLAARLAGPIFAVPELVLIGLYRILAYNVER